MYAYRFRTIFMGLSRPFDPATIGIRFYPVVEIPRAAIIVKFDTGEKFE